VFIGLLVASFLIPLNDEEDFLGIIMSIDWEVIVFLFCIFTIVEIFKYNSFFDTIAIKIVNKFYYKPRRMFYAICITSTLIATIIEDLSVAIIFIPIMIAACRKMNISPLPYLFGITICINIASTLTPFGSAENVIIANYFNLDLYWHLIYLGVYFVVTTIITLVLLDVFILRRYIKFRKQKNPITIAKSIAKERKETESKETLFEIRMDRRVFIRNLVGLILFILLLGTVPRLLITGPLGLLLFVILNPIEKKKGKRPDVSFFLRKIDAKIIYFFICLFILVHILDLIGVVGMIEQ
jgi:Na+/H+ antiporter NhaD/arsenite permease-like protein